ncbi:hypothetical protein TNIN_466431 [Trichonephila inaurata madagascariensis]|uniref:Uncharacterized protein n=1 Tax=Trichonephila inaurata madagascariensis TaxID=2747483 RepID=A0A8X6XCM5_9ARAC|nr:hypothetical protein TNIN_466431 [Trichonephila inaurata madagascariensis]
MANDHDSNMECTNVPLPTSRTSSPDLFTPCEQLIQVQNEIKKFTLLTLGAQQSLNSLAPFMTTDDPEVSELFQRLKFYEEELRRSECEYGTLSPCTTPGCAVYGTPPSTPSKSLKDYPALPKTISNKRKESDDGFISPTRRQTIKKPNLITNSNFSLETGNVYESLKEKDITGTSNTQDTTLDTNISPNTTQIKKFLPPPVMLFCTDTIRDIMKIINNSFPNLRSKLSVESIVRPNVSYAQATNPQISKKTTHQMATRNEVPAIPQQPQANRKIKIPPIAPINNIPENTPQHAIIQTLQQTMQTLAVLTQQIAALNFNTPGPLRGGGAC